MANAPGQPTAPAGPIEADARKAVEPAGIPLLGPIQVFIVSSRYGPEGIYSTADKARDKVNLLMTLAAYRNAESGLMVRPYVLDSE